MTSILTKRCIWKQRHTGSVACSNDDTQKNCVTAIQGMPNRASKPPEAGKWQEGASHSFQKEHGPVDTLGFASQPSELSNDVFLWLYLCVWCAVYVYICTGMHSCLCAYSGAREECRQPCSITSSYSLETGSFTEAELLILARLNGQQARRSCLSHTHVWPLPDFEVGTGDSDLGLYTCTVGAVMHRASSQPSVAWNHPVWSLLLQQPQEMNFSVWPLKSTHARSPLMVLREPASYTPAFPSTSFPGCAWHLHPTEI